MWSCHRDQMRLVLALIGFPQKRISFQRSDSAGRLAAQNLVVQVRPPAATALFTQRADLLPHFYAAAEFYRGIERIQMRVAVIPAAVVQNPDRIVVSIFQTGVALLAI